jgi:hypothetical protein
LKDATKPPAKKKASSKTTLKNTAQPRKITPQSKTVDASVQKLQAPASLSSPVDTTPFPYHLKWHEAGIDFELHSSDARFMSQQAWKVQQALAGLLPLKQSSYTPAIKASSEPLPQAVPVAQPVPAPQPTQEAPPPPATFQRQVPQSPINTPNTTVSGDLDLDQFKAWVEASTIKHNAQDEVAQQLFPNLRAYSPASNQMSPTPKHAVSPVQEAPLPSAVETLIQQTQQAFQAPPPMASVNTVQQQPEEPLVFSTLLNDFQASPASKNEASTPDFKGYLSQARFNDITEVLLLAGEYLRTHQHQSTFGSSQLKHLVASADAGHLNHAVLERALAQRYIEVVPDLTGNATSMEYRLTQVGKTYVQQLKG